MIWWKGRGYWCSRTIWTEWSFLDLFNLLRLLSEIFVDSLIKSVRNRTLLLYLNGEITFISFERQLSVPLWPFFTLNTVIRWHQESISWLTERFWIQFFRKNLSWFLELHLKQNIQLLFDGHRYFYFVIIQILSL